MMHAPNESPKGQSELAFENQSEADTLNAAHKKKDPYEGTITNANLPPASHEQDIRPAKKSRYAPIGSLEFFGIFLLLLIPIVNIVLLLIWALGGCKKINKRNFARAYLVMLALFIGLGFWTFTALKKFYHDAFVEGNLPPGSRGANMVQFFQEKAADLLVNQAAKQFADSAASPADASNQQNPDLTAIAGLVIAQDREGLRELGFSDDVIDGLLAAAKDPKLLAGFLSQAQAVTP